MFEQIKTYANAILAIVLLAGLAYSHWYAWSHGKAAGEAVVQAKFDAYKENINEQVQKAKDAAAKAKLEQDAKYAKAKYDYNDASHNLDTALKRLRDFGAVSGQESVPVAGTGDSTMPAQAGNTSQPSNPAAFGAGTFQSVGEFYEASLRDTAQCKALIEFVR